MAIDIIQLPADGAGKKIAARSYTENAQTVYAQAGYLTTDTAVGNPAAVQNTGAAGTEYALITRDGNVINNYKTASATPDTGIGAVTMPDRRYTSVTLATAANSTQSWDTMGANTMIVHVASTTTGTIIFEVSADGTNWLNAETRDVSLDLWVSGQNLTPTANKVYRIGCNGWRSVRARVVTALGATVALTATLATITTIINALDSGAAPHNIGYTLTSRTAQYTTAQTGVALWTPTTGRRLIVTSYQIQAGGTTAGTAQLWYGASADTAYTRGTDLAIFDGEFAPSATSKPGVVQTGAWPASVADHVLRVTTSAAINPFTVTVWGYEV